MLPEDNILEFKGENHNRVKGLKKITIIKQLLKNWATTQSIWFNIKVKYNSRKLWKENQKEAFSMCSSVACIGKPVSTFCFLLPCVAERGYLGIFQ